MLSVLASVNGFMVPGLQTAAGARIAHAAAVPLATVRMSEVVDDVEQVYKDADAVFACIDTDGNGAITQEELISHLTSSGYKEEAVEKIFSKLDTNKDGALSKEELREGMVNYSASSGPRSRCRRRATRPGARRSRSSSRASRSGARPT